MTTSSDIGKLLLRLLIGALMLFHGVAKLNHGIAFITSKITEQGLPEILSYGVYVGEVVAPILLIIGLKTRFSAFLIACTMFVAVYLVHWNDLWSISNTGGLVTELQLLYLGGSIVIMFLGAGKFSFDKN
ncbi:MAG: DoxX family protein [Candidatus Marinarcus sp.]|uniref:DoxX family protein n=1 Tax=Candidatus Marinarcus sp. TaxID=3100987 RepID=UPI003B000B1D